MPDDFGDTGPSDLAKAAADEHGIDDPKGTLERLHFKAGFQRLWQRADRGQILIFVYEFDSPQDSEAWYAISRQRTETAATAAIPSPSFEVTGINQGSGVQTTSKGYAAWSIQFVTGKYWVSVAVGTYGPDNLQELATRIALEQSSRLA